MGKNDNDNRQRQQQQQRQPWRRIENIWRQSRLHLPAVCFSWILQWEPHFHAASVHFQWIFNYIRNISVRFVAVAVAAVYIGNTKWVHICLTFPNTICDDVANGICCLSFSFVLFFICIFVAGSCVFFFCFFSLFIIVGCSHIRQPHRVLGNNKSSIIIFFSLLL